MSALSPNIIASVTNDSGSTIPPRSIVVVTSVETIAETSNSDAETILHIGQYNGSAGVIMVTGPAQIRSGDRGSAFFDGFIYVSIDPGVSTPNVGEEWGPAPGSWVLTRGGSGFVCAGYSTNGGDPKRALFYRVPPKFFWGKTTTTIAAATALETPASFSANIWLPTTASAGGSFSVATQAAWLGITVYNRDPNYSTSKTGLSGRFEWAWNEWTAILGCDPP